MKLSNSAAAVVVSIVLSGMASGQEMITVQGNLPRLNYRDNQGALLWSLPANSVLWKLDGPFNAGVIVSTAAAPSGSITLNEGGVSIRGTGFPSAKLHVGTEQSATEPGEVKIDPGNPNAPALITAMNVNLPAILQMRTKAANQAAAVRLISTTTNFSVQSTTAFAIRDNKNAVIPISVVPGTSNNNALVIRNGNIGLRVANPTAPLVLLNGASCSVGGVWTNASSRDLKQDVESIKLDDALKTLNSLQPVTYRYKAEPDEVQAGFVAEDVPDMVATKSRKDLSPMDFVAVLTKVVQDQQTRIEAQEEQLNRQAEMLEEQRKMIDELMEHVRK